MTKIDAQDQGPEMMKKEKTKLSIAPGQAIRARREILGWRAVELARRSGVNPRTLDAIEKGRIESPSLRNLGAIARALGISVATLDRKSVV